MRNLVFLACLGAWLLLLPGAHAQPVGEAGTPAWVLEDMQAMIGVWIADNSAYQSEHEPFEAYGLEWRWSLGEKSLTGRLFGLKDGQEAGTFWEFRQFWHPGERRLMLYQFGGDGTIGIGTVTRVGPDETRTEQQFFSPDGRISRTGHRSVRVGDVDDSRSYTITDDGIWEPRRAYLWRRQ